MFIIYVRGGGREKCGGGSNFSDARKGGGYVTVVTVVGEKGGGRNFGSVKRGGYVTFCGRVQVFPPPLT